MVGFSLVVRAVANPNPAQADYIPSSPHPSGRRRILRASRTRARAVRGATPPQSHHEHGVHSSCKARRETYSEEYECGTKGETEQTEERGEGNHRDNTGRTWSQNKEGIGMGNNRECIEGTNDKRQTVKAWNANTRA